MLAVVMFVLVKLVIRVGIARTRSFDTKQCPYCYTDVPPKALVCKSCCQPLVEDLPSLAEARRLAEDAQARRLLPIPVSLRRRDTTCDETAGGEAARDDAVRDDAVRDDALIPQPVTNGADRRK
jgi:ribosomal protein L40E